MANICFIVSSYYPSTGGVQKITKGLCEELVKKNNQVTVITAFENLKKTCDIVNGVKILRFNVYMKNGFVLGEIKKLNHYLVSNQHNFDIYIYVCLDSPFVIASLKSLNKIYIKKILYMHGLAEYRLKLSLIIKKDCLTYIKNYIRINYILIKYRKVIENFDTIITLSKNDSSFKYFKKYYNIPVYELNNYVDDEFFYESNRNNLNNEKYSVCVANYYHIKNQITLLKSVYNVTNNYPIIFIGSKETEYYKYLINENKKYAEKFGINKAYFYVGLKRQKVIEIMRNSYFFCMSSKAEMFPLVICESMTLGIPFISTDVGIVKTLPGGIIIKNDYTYISNIMTKLYNDSKLIEQLGEEGKTYAYNHFRKIVYLDNFYKVLRNIGLVI